MRVVGWLAIAVFGLAVVLGLCFGLTWLGIEWRGFFGPKRAAVERRIFEETPSYIHGMKQDLMRYRHQWMTADEEKRMGIESTVRMRFAQFDPRHLEDPELSGFYRKCMSRQGE
jgi:hypothetical protein